MGHRSAPSSKVSVALERTRAPIVLGQMLGRPENGRPYGRYDRIGNGRACGESVFGAAISGGPRTAAPTGGTTASGTAAPAGNPYLAPQSRAARERPPLRVVRPHRERPRLRGIRIWRRNLGRPENGRPYGWYDRIGNGRACGESVFGAAISGGPRTAAPTGGTTAPGTAAPTGNSAPLCFG